MGEKSVAPHKNGKCCENADDEMETNDNENEEVDDITPEEFNVIDNQLNALNSALDDLEQKNDNIQAQLLQLLESNRQIRQQLQEENINTKTN